MHDRKREFIELFNGSGYKQAELARILELSRGGMNGIIKGDTVPSESLLRHLKLELASVNKPFKLAESPAAYGLEAELDGLTSKDREDVIEVFKLLTKQARRRVGKG